MAPPPDKTRKSRSRKGRNSLIIVVEPTLEYQSIYNDIRDDEARHAQRQNLQQHVTSQGFLCPPRSRDHRAPSTSQSTTNESQGSLSPASTTDLPDHAATPTADPGPRSGRRPRGRRVRPLETDKRFRTFIKRKLKLVCERCKQKKVMCDHFDLSKLEDCYQANRRAVAEQSPMINRPLDGFDPAPAPRDDTVLIGLESNQHVLELEDDMDDFAETVQPPNARQYELHQYLSEFDLDSIRFGTGPLPMYVSDPYNPGMATPAPHQPMPERFPIGSEMLGYPRRWRCEHSNSEGSTRTGSSALSDACTWTGPLIELERHFITEHRQFQNPSFLCQCEVCSTRTNGWDPPTVCLGPDCSPYGNGHWRRWWYGYALESAVASTPALTARSGESEGENSFNPGGPAGNGPSGNGQNGSLDMWDGSFGGDAGMGFYYHYTNTTGKGGGGDGGSLHDACPVIVTQYPSFLVLLLPTRSRQGMDPDLVAVSKALPASLIDCNLLDSLMSPSHCGRRAAQLWPCILCFLVLWTLVAVAFEQDLIPPSFYKGEGTARCVAHMPLSYIPPLSAALILCGFATTWLFRWWTRSHHHPQHLGFPCHPQCPLLYLRWVSLPSPRFPLRQIVVRDHYSAHSLDRAVL